MSVFHAQRAVGTSAVPVTVAESNPAAGAEWHLSNVGLTTVYIGGADVTTSTGYGLAGGKDLWVNTWPGEILYAVAATAGQSLHVLGTRV